MSTRGEPGDSKKPRHAQNDPPVPKSSERRYAVVMIAVIVTIGLILGIVLAVFV